MDNQFVEKCPKCGNYTQGVPSLSTSRRMVQTTIKSGTSKIICSIVAGVIGLFLGGVGAIVTTPLGFFIGSLISSNFSKDVANVVDESMYENTTYCFTCLKCGAIWSKIFKTGQYVDSTTDKELEEQKARRISIAKSNMWFTPISFVILAILTFFDGRYLYLNDLVSYRDTTIWGFNMTVSDYDYLWLLLAFVEIFLVVGMIWAINSFFSNYTDYRTLTKMSVKDFRCSQYRI